MTHDGPSFPSNEANSEESRKLKPVMTGQTNVAYTDIPSQMLRHTSCTNAAACFEFGVMCSAHECTCVVSSSSS